MATRRKKSPNGGVVGRLADRGEEAVTKVFDELGRNPRVTDALGKAMAAKGRLDSASRSALASIGLAASDELRDLRKEIERLERRLAKLESSGSSRGSAKRSETKKTPSAKRSTTRSSTAKKTSRKASSPSPGRSLGGGAGRGSSPGGGASG
jgi:hypothetical protein